MFLGGVWWLALRWRLDYKIKYTMT